MFGEKMQNDRHSTGRSAAHFRKRSMEGFKSEAGRAEASKAVTVGEQPQLSVLVQCYIKPNRCSSGM